MARRRRGSYETARKPLAMRASVPRAGRVVVVADTHSRPHPESHRLIEERDPDLILHAGDIGDLAVLDGLRALAPTIAVRGNIDSRGTSLPDAIDLTLTDEEEPHLVLFLTHIAIQGVRLRADVARNATAQHASIVVCGHSHIPFVARDRGLVVFNPGSIGPRRFRLPITFGVLDLAEDGPRMTHVSCESGEAWLPPTGTA